ncbi:hypothetical protein OROGR_004764 [Orobanche gracilis]
MQRVVDNLLAITKEIELSMKILNKTLASRRVEYFLYEVGYQVLAEEMGLVDEIIYIELWHLKLLFRNGCDESSCEKS